MDRCPLGLHLIQPEGSTRVCSKRSARLGPLELAGTGSAQVFEVVYGGEVLRAAVTIEWQGSCSMFSTEAPCAVGAGWLCF